jgi:hypothetical protein
MFKHLIVLGCLALGACSADGGGGRNVDGSGNQGSGAGSPGPSGNGSGNTGGSLALDPGITTGGTGMDMGCASESQEAHAIPTDLLVLLDQSGSMTLEGDRWDPTSAALKAFAVNPGSNGLGVGLQYFPLGATTTEDPAICQPANYVMPDVPIGALPDNAMALTGSIDAHYFTAAEGEDAAHWGTPTRPAVEGALQYLTSHQTANPDRRVYLLLATDGQPSKLCPGNSIDGIASVIALAAAQTPPIQTFVVGIGNLAGLTALADAGATGHPAFIVDAAGTATEAQLSAALEAIRHTALPCEFAIPQPSFGRIDPGQVNVELTDAAGKTTFPKVASAAACAAGESTWYYDSETAPSKVIMCPAACDNLKAGEARIDIVFGCKTVTK